MLAEKETAGKPNRYHATLFELDTYTIAHVCGNLVHRVYSQWRTLRALVSMPLSESFASR